MPCLYCSTQAVQFSTNYEVHETARKTAKRQNSHPNESVMTQMLELSEGEFKITGIVH